MVSSDGSSLETWWASRYQTADGVHCERGMCDAPEMRTQNDSADGMSSEAQRQGRKEKTGDRA